jgi:uncharacterized protein YcfL
MKKIGILLLFLLLTGCSCKRKEEIKVESPVQQEEIVVEEIEEKTDTMKIKIKNTTDKLQYVDSVLVGIRNKEDKQIEDVRVYVYETLGINGEKELEIKIKTPLEQVETYTYDIIR